MRAAFALLLLIVITGCGNTRERRTLAAERRVWEADRPHAYSFLFATHCPFCNPGTYRIHVPDGKITSVAPVEGAAPVGTVMPLLERTVTIDSVFSWLDRAYASHADIVQVQYDPVMHYPMRSYVQQDRRAEDSGLGLEVGFFAYER